MPRIDIVADSSAYLPVDLFVCELSPVIASHVGPGTVALAFYQEFCQGGQP